MQYKKYGKTNIKVSRIGFGGMRFEDIKDEEGCVALICSAYQAGINYFDTAPIYCQSKSEKIFGQAFIEMKKTRAEKPYYISTKTFASQDSQIRRDLETSLKRLQVDVIDFYHVWCLIRPEQYRERIGKGLLKTFSKLKEEGLIRNICVSSHMNGDDTAKVLRDYPFEGVLLGYSAMNFSYRESAIEQASQLGRGVVVMNPLGGGLIPQHPEKFAFVKTQPDESIVQGALRFLLSDSRITTILVGFSQESHIREAISSLEEFQPISDEKMQKIRAGVRESFNTLCTGCGYCKNCPGELPIPRLMDSYNQFLLKQDKYAMIDRLRWHWGILKEGNNLEQCVECGQCELDCTQKIPIIQRLKDIRHKIHETQKNKK